MELTKAAKDVLAERAAHATREGWTPKHDDQHDSGEMARAAGVYAIGASGEGWAFNDFKYGDDGEPLFPAYWPWDARWFKPKGDREDLVRAGALILAEIERIDRAASNTKPQS